MAGVKGKSGGKRPGAGRRFKTEGCVTKVMRVPSYMKESIETLIRVQAEWLSEDEERKPVGYLDSESGLASQNPPSSASCGKVHANSSGKRHMAIIAKSKKVNDTLTFLTR